MSRGSRGDIARGQRISPRAALASVAQRAELNSRESKWKLYERLFPPTNAKTVLDVGVSSLDDLPGENYFLKRFPHPRTLTAVGVDDLTGLEGRYPGVTFVRADGRRLPFPDRSFDVVHSNAVVEHVGPRRDQARFVEELFRVGKSVFVTTPNRWFPVETHSKLPLLHWLPRRVVTTLAQKLHQPDLGWWLLSEREFRALVPPSVETSMYTTRYFGWPLTLVLVGQHSDRSRP